MRGLWKVGVMHDRIWMVAVSEESKHLDGNTLEGSPIFLSCKLGISGHKVNNDRELDLNEGMC